MGMNKAFLIGNVGKDPEHKTLESGTEICTFSLATSDRRFKDDEGNPRTEWHNIVAWGKVAGIIRDYVTKGTQLSVIGQIRTRKYEKDGEAKYFTEIHIEDMEILSKKGAAAESDDQDVPY